MKRFRIFEDSAPFSLVIKQSVQETPAANSSLFTWDPDSTLGVWAWEVSYQNCCGNGMKMSKTFLSESTLCSGRLSPFVILCE